MTVEQEVEAAEFVLGTLSRDERDVFAARLEGDAEAREAVAAWERRLAGLADGIPGVDPPAEVWLKIEEALNRVDARAPRLTIVPGSGRPVARAPAGRALKRWRAAAISSSGLAAALLVVVGIREVGQGAEEPSYVAAVNRGGDQPALLVRVDLKTHRVTVRSVAAQTPAGKSLQLWYIGLDQHPQSFGLVDKMPMSMPLPDGVRTESATFAVSVEPVGGSRSGGPTGPVVYSGQLLQD